MLGPKVTKHLRLTSVGDEFALVLDQETLDAVGYAFDTVVELPVEDGSLVIEPVRVEAPSSGSSLRHPSSVKTDWSGRVLALGTPRSPR